MGDKEDTDFFRQQMRGIKKLKTEKIELYKPKIKPRVKAPESFEKETEFPFLDHITESVTATTQLFFSQPGIQPKTLRDLKKGKISFEECLDLHGSTVNQARTELGQFLSASVTHQKRCILIIHGKGKLDKDPPLLKNLVNHWLKQHPAVLAFASAIPKDGGTGAVYVLLKRNPHSPL